METAQAMIQTIMQATPIKKKQKCKNKWISFGTTNIQLES